MKLSQYFKTKAEMDAYYPNGVPSNVLAIVQPDASTRAALYTSSNNSPVGGGSSEEQGGGGQGADTKYYWCPDSENAPTTYYPFEVIEDNNGIHYSYSLGNLTETNENGALFANINTDRFNWNGFLYFDPFEVSSETVAGYQESRPIQLVRSSGEAGPDKSGGINLVETTLTNATLEIANDDLGFPVIILTNGA